MLQIFSLTLFEKTPINSFFDARPPRIELVADYGLGTGRKG
jgi:hypothetical protein